MSSKSANDALNTLIRNDFRVEAKTIYATLCGLHPRREHQQYPCVYVCVRVCVRARPTL